MGRPEHPGVHMNRWRMRVLHMGDQRDARSPEAWIILHPWNPARRHCLLRGSTEFAIDFGGIHADLFEDTPPAHHGHHTTTCVGSIFGSALGFRALEFACPKLRRWSSFLCGFQPFEGRDDLIAQLAKPCRCFGFFCFKSAGHWPNASLILYNRGIGPSLSQPSSKPSESSSRRI